MNNIINGERLSGSLWDIVGKERKILRQQKIGIKNIVSVDKSKAVKTVKTVKAVKVEEISSKDIELINSFLFVFDKEKVINDASTKTIRVILKKDWVDYIYNKKLTIKSFVTSLVENFIINIENNYKISKHKGTSKLTKFERYIINEGGGKKCLYKGEKDVLSTKTLVYTWQYNYFNKVNISNFTNILFLICKEYFD